jgi:hypothetical protein
MHLGTLEIYDNALRYAVEADYRVLFPAIHGFAGYQG